MNIEKTDDQDNVEIDIGVVTPKCWRIYLGLMDEENLNWIEKGIYRIFLTGADFHKNFMTYLAADKFDPELAKDAFIGFFGQDIWNEMTDIEAYVISPDNMEIEVINDEPILAIN
jgi:hypothetical protein